MFEILKNEGAARRGEFTCAHGTVQTPVFMNVGTQGAIKGALSAEDLKNIGCQVELSNTYHLHLRPGSSLPCFSECPQQIPAQDPGMQPPHPHKSRHCCLRHCADGKIQPPPAAHTAAHR